MADSEVKVLEAPIDVINYLVMYSESRAKRDQELTLARVEKRTGEGMCWVSYLFDGGPIIRYGNVPGVVIPNEVALALAPHWQVNDTGRYVGTKTAEQILKIMEEHSAEWAHYVTGVYADLGESQLQVKAATRNSKRATIAAVANQLLGFVLANSQELGLDDLDLSTIEHLASL